MQPLDSANCVLRHLFVLEYDMDQSNLDLKGRGHLSRMDGILKMICCMKQVNLVKKQLKLIKD